MTQILDAMQIVDNLMASDEATLKSGYTLENAILAAVEYLNLNMGDEATLRRLMNRKFA